MRTGSGKIQRCWSWASVSLPFYHLSKFDCTIDVKMDGSVLKAKSSFKKLGLSFSFKLDWGYYIISIAKTAFKKIETLIRSMKFVSLEVGLYVYKSTMRPSMEYYCHFWDVAPTCYLKILGKLQKWICRMVGPSLAAFFEVLAQCWNVAEMA